MSVDALMTSIATLITVTDGADDDVYGNPTDAEVESTVRCEVQQVRRDEVEGTANWSEGMWRAFFPAGTDVTGADRLVVDGDTFEFVGPPWKVRNPRTRQVSHVEATLRRVT